MLIDGQGGRPNVDAGQSRAHYTTQGYFSIEMVALFDLQALIQAFCTSVCA